MGDYRDLVRAGRGPIGHRAWTPRRLQGLAGWWRADQVVASGGLIGTWTDLSGSGRDLTAAGAFRPTSVAAVVNGRPVVRFAGAQFVQSAGISLAGQPTTWWVTFRATAQASGPFVGNGAQNALDGSGTNTLTMTGASGLAATQDITGSFRTIVCAFNGASSVMRVNGVQVASGTTGSAGTITSIWVGSTQTHFMSGDIAEVGFVLGRALTVGAGLADLYRVERYNRRWYAAW